MNTLGERLTYARKYNRHTQESLAESIGVSRGVIYNIEKGKRKDDGQDIVINAICKELKINKDWLVSGTGEMEDNSLKSAKVLDELYEVAKELSIEEQLFLLDMVKSLKTHLSKPCK